MSALVGIVKLALPEIDREGDRAACVLGSGKIVIQRLPPVSSVSAIRDPWDVSTLT